LPLAQATAMPRRLRNHSEVSATSGEKVQAVPSRPISRQWAAMKNQMLGASAAAMKPPPRQAPPSSSGRMMPERSAMRPMKAAHAHARW
jgi:hypothetical protein